MKKSLIALAVVAASGAAMAQSTVTLFGRVDASIGSSESAVAGSKSVTQMFNGSAGGLTGSRWGMQGTEDLGGGLKAVFKLENRFNVDDGTSVGGFTGDAYVGLEGGFGAVHLGRSYTAYDSVFAISNGSNVFDSSFTPTGDVYGNGGNYPVRAANQIKYVSPSFGGVTVGLTHGFDEVNGVSNDVTTLGVRYAGGPLTVGFGYAADANDTDFTVLTGAYNFGVASISGGYQIRDGATTDDSEFNIGVNIPMDAFNFSIGYAAGETETKGGAKVSEASGWGLGVTYTLSKRTRLYAGYKDTEIENAAGVTTGGVKLYAVGIRHDF